MTDKSGIENACNDSNKRKFTQTKSTPPMTSPLVDNLGYTGNYAHYQAILNGTYQPPDKTDPYTKEYLHYLKAPIIKCYQPTATVTTESYQQLWTRAKERTSSGLTKIHFEHMKACSHDEKLSKFEATMSHIPYML